MKSGLIEFFCVYPLMKRYVSQWGGMDVGDGMLYPASVVDGLVHQLGGTKLAIECKWITSFRGGCPIGTSVTTQYGSEELMKAFDMIIHTSPPFYRHHDDSINLLRHCYKSSLFSAFSEDTDKRVAVPLIGAGGRGFPLETALNIAAAESTIWKDDERSSANTPKTIAFGIPEMRVALRLLQLLEEENRY
jgi:O-acetyl-ADP-ribose deacetylase (regulator of RNase III)